MKKIFALFLALLAIVPISSCGRAEKTASKTAKVREPPEPAEESEPSVSSRTTGEPKGGQNGGADETAAGSASEPNGERKMKIGVTDGKYTIIFELNETSAAKSLYAQLPLTVDVENYSDNEKIFYPKKLNTDGAVNTDAKKGTLAYFSPWGDVVMYYKDAGPYDGLYELGRAVSGSDGIGHLSGKIEVTALE